MAELTVDPEDLSASASLTGRDVERLTAAAVLLRSASELAVSGVGASHPSLARAASEVLHTQVVAASALGTAARILSDGFAGAAEDYRDAEIRIGSILRRVPA